MAISTRTIQDSINWAKRFNFNRNPVIGNSLEPALTCANIVLQTILGPPFEWWWNNEELTFTTDPTPNSATSSVIDITSGVLTVTATNTFAVGDLVLGSDTGSDDLDGTLIEILTATTSSFTASLPNQPDFTGTTGTFTNVTTQDYTIPAPVFDHIEHASVLDVDNDGVPVKWYELTIKNNLSLESSQNRPEFLSPHTEDTSGNVTFRVFSSPDKKYPVAVHVQLAAPQITSMNQTWSPLPDFMQHVYDLGFLAWMLQFADDPRSVYYHNQFKAALLGRSEGLTEEQKNIFLNNWDDLQAGYLVKMQQGIAARGQ